MNSKSKSAVVAALVMASVAPAFAVGPDFSALTAAVDVSTVGPAILAVAALLMLPKIIGWGARKVLGFVRG